MKAKIEVKTEIGEGFIEAIFEAEKPEECQILFEGLIKALSLQ